jgi:hypothetical protein
MGEVYVSKFVVLFNYTLSSSTRFSAHLNLMQEKEGKEDEGENWTASMAVALGEPAEHFQVKGVGCYEFTRDIHSMQRSRK